MNRSYSFRVPASTSNLGAGFDALSLALQRYLRISLTIEPSPGRKPSEVLRIDVRGVDAHLIPASSENLILRVASNVARERKRPLPGFRMTIDNEIPLARGMGSSAAAIIAGITCYELAAKERLSEKDIFRHAHEFESHPDNLAAALRGGLVVATESAEGGVVIA